MGQASIGRGCATGQLGINTGESCGLPQAAEPLAGRRRRSQVGTRVGGAVERAELGVGVGHGRHGQRHGAVGAHRAARALGAALVHVPPPIPRADLRHAGGGALGSPGAAQLASLAGEPASNSAAGIAPPRGADRRPRRTSMNRHGCLAHSVSLYSSHTLGHCASQLRHAGQQAGGCWQPSNPARPAAAHRGAERREPSGGGGGPGAGGGGRSPTAAGRGIARECRGRSLHAGLAGRGHHGATHAPGHMGSAGAAADTPAIARSAAMSARPAAGRLRLGIGQMLAIGGVADARFVRSAVGSRGSTCRVPRSPCERPLSRRQRRQRGAPPPWARCVRITVQGEVQVA